MPCLRGYQKCRTALTGSTAVRHGLVLDAGSGAGLLFFLGGFFGGGEAFGIRGRRTGCFSGWGFGGGFGRRFSRRFGRGFFRTDFRVRLEVFGDLLLDDFLGVFLFFEGLQLGFFLGLEFFALGFGELGAGACFGLDAGGLADASAAGRRARRLRPTPRGAR